jgi:hypothetical protein
MCARPHARFRWIAQGFAGSQKSKAIKIKGYNGEFRSVVTQFRQYQARLGLRSTAKRIEHTMTRNLKSALRHILLLSLTIAAAAAANAETAAPPNAVVYFINLKDGDAVKSPFKIQFGLSGMGVAPAGLTIIICISAADRRKQR